MKRATVLGGTGVFGGRIAAGLAASPDIQVTIASRRPERAAAFAETIGASLVRCDASDVASIESILHETDLLVHTAGPFQGNDYSVAEACIRNGVHYLDIADGREFVCGIGTLNQRAKESGVVVGSGASTVPVVTHAMITELASEFSEIDTIQIALSPGNQNPRGPSTIGAILTYVGRPMRVWEKGKWKMISGWSDPRVLEFPPNVGPRHVYRCDVPDLDIFPSIFRAETIRFHAGVELNIINYTLSGITRLRRLIPMPWLPKLASLFTRISLLGFRWGSKNGAIALWMHGRNAAGDPIERRIAIVTDNDGPATPSSPGILLGRKILLDNSLPTGAYPCHGYLTINELMLHLEALGIWCVKGNERGWDD